MAEERVVDDPLALLGRAAAGLTLENLPAEAVQRAKQRVLDTIGCLVAGYHCGISDSIRSYVAAAGGSPQATLLPGGEKTTVALVGLAHATYIHGLELSDAAPRGTCHPGNEIVPAAMAMAEFKKLGGAAIIPAVVAGYEVEVRLGRTLFPSANYVGWWTPGLFGAIGPAVTAAHIMGLGAEGIDNTIGIAVNLAPTSVAKANEEGNTIKWLIGGQACATGVLAAEMAARGTKGMRDVKGGWIPVISKDCHPERLTEGINADGTFTQWELLSGVLTKHYATVGPLTAALDATFSIIKEHNVHADDVVSIDVDAMYRTKMFDKVHPENEIAARASLAYCLALAVVTRDPAQLLGPGYSEEKLRDKAIWAMAEKVKVTESQEYEDQYPAKSLAKVTLRLKNGKSPSCESDRSANPRYLRPSDADIENKFRLIATSVLGQAKTDRVVALCQKLETLPDMRELLDALRLK